MENKTLEIFKKIKQINNFYDYDKCNQLGKMYYDNVDKIDELTILSGKQMKYINIFKYKPNEICVTMILESGTKSALILEKRIPNKKYGSKEYKEMKQGK